MRQLKIALVTGIFPPDIGGPATYVPQVATGLAERGHRITVLTLSDRVDHADGQYPFRVVRLPRPMLKLGRWLRTVAAIMRLGWDADVLFVNGLTTEAVLANLVLRKPMIQKVVGDRAWERATRRRWTKEDFEDFQQRRHGPQVEALKALRSWGIRKADRVIVPSHYLARWVQSWGVPEAKIAVIHNAVEPLNGIAPAEVPLQTPIKAVTVGRLVPWKYIDQVIEAISRSDDWGLVVIGDGPERGRLEALASASGIAERVYFAGARPKAETLALMAACDILVLNSTYEGFPHVVLEAMQLGLPVVATAMGGIPEVVWHGETGILIQWGDTNALHEALKTLANSPETWQRLSQGAKRMVNRFSLSNMIVETEQVLVDAVKQDLGGVLLTKR